MEERGKRMCQLLWHHDTIEWGPTSPCASSAEGMWRGWNLGAQPARGDVVREEPWSACTPLSLLLLGVFRRLARPLLICRTVSGASRWEKYGLELPTWDQPLEQLATLGDDGVWRMNRHGQHA